MKKLSALETIDINGAIFAPGDTFNIDDGTAQELIGLGKAELVPDLVANDITAADGTIDRAAYENGMRRESEATGKPSGLKEPEKKKAGETKAPADSRVKAPTR